MRLVAGLFALLLSASLVHADEVKAPEPQPEVTRARVPLRVVRVLPESHQALLFDNNRGTHVLASEGGTIAGYTVIEIGEDEVVLTADGTQVVLAAPARTWRRAPRATEVGTAAPRPAAAAASTPVDPYASAGPIDPYLAPYTDPVRTIDAPRPIEAGEGGVRVAEAPGPRPAAPPVMITPGAGPGAGPEITGSAPSVASHAPIAPIAPVTAPAGPPAHAISDAFASALTGAPAPTAATIPAPPSTPALTIPGPPAPAPADEDPYADTDGEFEDEASDADPAIDAAPVAEIPAASAPAPLAPAPLAPTVLSRRELTTALADFTRLTGVLRGSFTATGARLDVVAPGSVFAKAGLRPGDIVTAVDGKPLRTIDDAADLYVRAASTRAANIQVARAGVPLTLRVLLQ